MLQHAHMSTVDDSEWKRHQYRRHGFFVQQEAVPPDAVRLAKEELAQMAGLHHDSGDASNSRFKWDGENSVTLNSKLWPLATCPTILHAARQILGEQDLVYAERSQAKVWRNCPMTGGHRDNIDTEFGKGSEWHEGYDVVNVALYLQGSEEGFEWGTVPGSHRGEYTMAPWERRLWRRLRRPGRIGSRLGYLDAEDGWLPLRVRPAWWPVRPPAAEIWLPTRPGDCILFDPRLIHAGGPVLGWKYAVFFSLGSGSIHTQRHANHFGPDRRGHRELYAEFEKILRGSGVSLIP